MAFRLITTLAIMALIFLFSAVPGEPQPGDALFVKLIAMTPSFVQNAGHLVLYGGLSWLWFWTLEDIIVRQHHRVLAAFVIAASYGTFLEWYQTYVPGRFGSVKGGMALK